MSTLANKLQYLVDTKSEIRKAIVAKNITVESSTPFRNYADKISEIIGGDVEKYFIYKSGNELDGHNFTIYQKGSASQKTEGWIYMHYFYMQVLSSDLIKTNGYKRIGLTLLADATKFNHPTRFTNISLRDTPEASLSGNDYSPVESGTTFFKQDIVLYPNTKTYMSGTFYFDIPADLEEFYIVFNTVNVDCYIEEIWLEGTKLPENNYTLDLTEVTFDGQDMSTWTQVNPSVTYIHTYANNINKYANYVGGGCFERWYKKLPELERGKTYLLKFKMWSPTGFTYGNYGGDNKVYAIITDSLLSNIDYSCNRYLDYEYIKSYIKLDPSKATNTPTEYFIFFTYNKTSNSYPYYVFIDTGDITDGVSIELDISDINLYEVRVVE